MGLSIRVSGGTTWVCTGASVGVCTSRPASWRGISLRGEGIVEPDIPVNAARLLPARVTRAGNGCLPYWGDGGRRDRGMLIGLSPWFSQITSCFDPFEIRANPARFAAWVAVLARVNTAIRIAIALRCRDAARSKANDSEQGRRKKTGHIERPRGRHYGT